MQQQPPPTPPTRSTEPPPLLTAALLVVVVGGLKLAGDLLVPIVLAAFLAIVCIPLVNTLRGWGLAPTLAVVLTLVLVLALVLGTSVLVVDASSEFAARVPEYQARLKSMWHDALVWLESKGIELAPPKEREPLDPDQLMRTVSRVAGETVNAMSAVLLVLLIFVFMLFDSLGLPSKLRRAIGRPDADLSNFQRITREVYSYLGLKTAVSLLTGILFGAWCAVLGVEFFVLWGFLAFVLNFIPNIGSVLAAIPAVAVALLEAGPGMAIWAAAGNLVINQVVGNVVEPRIMGARLGLSPLVVFLSLVFWSWLWGPVGMLLSVPLTMVVKILLEASPRTQGIAVLLGPAGSTSPG